MVTEVSVVVVTPENISTGDIDPTPSASGPYYAPYKNVSDTILTLAATEAGAYVRCLNAAGCIITLNSGIFADNVEIHFRQGGAGPVIISAGAGVTINAPDGYVAESDSEGAVFTLKHITADEWDIFGKLATV